MAGRTGSTAANDLASTVTREKYQKATARQLRSARVEEHPAGAIHSVVTVMRGTDLLRASRSNLARNNRVSFSVEDFTLPRKIWEIGFRGTYAKCLRASPLARKTWDKVSGDHSPSS